MRSFPKAGNRLVIDCSPSFCIFYLLFLFFLYPPLCRTVICVMIPLVLIRHLIFGHFSSSSSTSGASFSSASSSAASPPIYTT
ncbi:hypothetical protein V8C26DRAFT_403286, partial [Trichoderma gracile]